MGKTTLLRSAYPHLAAAQSDPAVDVADARQDPGRLRFIEMEGRVVGAETVTVTKNEVLAALNKPEDYYILAVVFVGRDGAYPPRYVESPYEQEPDLATASVNYRIKELLPCPRTR